MSVGALCFVGAEARLADGVVLHPHAVVHAGCSIGARTEIHSGVVLCPGVRIGADCVVHAGTVLGSDGFGFEPTETGWQKIPQCGSVEVGDDVEIGANCTVDRGRFGPHARCSTGRRSTTRSTSATTSPSAREPSSSRRVGVSGSARIGRRAIVAGQAGISGHVVVGDGARVGGASIVTKDLEGGRDYWGWPARDKRDQLRAVSHLGRLPELAERVAELERRLAPGGPDPVEPAADRGEG